MMSKGETALKHLHNAKTRFYYSQTLMSNVGMTSELNLMFQSLKEPLHNANVGLCMMSARSKIIPRWEQCNLQNVATCRRLTLIHQSPK